MAAYPGDDVKSRMDGDDGRGRDNNDHHSQEKEQDTGQQDSSLGLGDKEIFNIAEAISDEMVIRRLGIELGYEWAKVDQFLKIQKVTHRDSNLSKDDSLRYATGLCNMPQLLELELDGVYVYPSFYGPFADPSSKCKIQTLKLSRQAFNKATFQAMLSAPSLRSLTLDRLMVLSRDEEDEPITMVPHVDSHVTELYIDDKTLLASRGLGLQTTCSGVTSVTLRCPRDELTKDVLQNLRFPLLHDLHLIGSTTVDTGLEESSSICSSLTELWPELASLSFSNILMDDAQVENILRTARRHRSLKRLKFFKCFSESDHIEHLCTKIREEGKIDIDIDIAGDEEFLVSDEEYEYSWREPFDPPDWRESFDFPEDFKGNDIDSDDDYVNDDNVDDKSESLEHIGRGILS